MKHRKSIYQGSTELNQSISNKEQKQSERYSRAPYDKKYEINPSYMNKNGYNMAISEKDENEISTIVSDRNKTTYAEFSVNNVQQISDDFYYDDRNKTIDAEFTVINTELIPDRKLLAKGILTQTVDLALNATSRIRPTLNKTERLQKTTTINQAHVGST